MNPITDLDQMPTVWRKTIKILLGQVVALQQGIDDVREATDQAAQELLAESPVLMQAFEELRLKNLKAKGAEFDEMDRFEFDVRLRAALNKALQAAVQSIEEEKLESMPVS